MEDNDEEHIEESISSSTSKRQRSTSVAWDNFEKLPLNSYPDNRLRAKCKKCGSVFLADSRAGTTSLHRHYAKHQVKVSQEPVDHEQYREKVSKAIVRHNYPFSFVEHEGIRELHLFLNPTVKTLSRNTARADVCKLYQKEKEALANGFFYELSLGIERKHCFPHSGKHNLCSSQTRSNASFLMNVRSQKDAAIFHLCCCALLSFAAKATSSSPPCFFSALVQEFWNKSLLVLLEKEL